MNKKDKMTVILACLLVPVTIYFVGVTTYQRFKRPDMTQTQLFLEIPNNLRLVFK